jgi:hypothetical protein
VRRSLGSCLGLQLRIHLRRCLMSSGSALPRGHEHRPVPHVPARRFPHIAWESQTAISRYTRLSCDCFANESQGLLGVRVGAEGPMLTPEERQEIGPSQCKCRDESSFCRYLVTMEPATEDSRKLGVARHKRPNHRNWGG